MFGITFKRTSTLSAIGQRVKNAVMSDRLESVSESARITVNDWIDSQLAHYWKLARLTDNGRNDAAKEYFELSYCALQIRSMSNNEFAKFKSAMDSTVDSLTQKQLKKLTPSQLVKLVLK